MSQVERLRETLAESPQSRPQPDPFLVALMRSIAEVPEAREEREEVEPPPERGNGQPAREEAKPTPAPRPSHVRFNRD